MEAEHQNVARPDLEVGVEQAVVIQEAGKVSPRAKAYIDQNEPKTGIKDENENIETDRDRSGIKDLESGRKLMEEENTHRN